jgi:threonine aldolase
VSFVSTGTAANALALAAFCGSHEAVVCHESAHLETDECGAPGFFTGGARLIVVRGEHGKLAPETVETAIVARAGDVHFSKPAAVSLTEATEMGTVYTPEEIRAIAGVCRRHGLRLHMDGARFANAVASLGVSPRAITWEAGVDVLSFGGTKNGMSLAEAVVFFDRALAKDFDYRRKQAGQLTSKMRYSAAPWPAMLRHGLWLRYARHANTMATRLAEDLGTVPGLRLLHPVQANAVFVDLAPPVHEALRTRWGYHTFEGNGFRFMCSWQTTDDDVQALVADLRGLMANAPRAAAP